MSLRLRHADHVALSHGSNDLESQADEIEHGHRHINRWSFANLLGSGRSPTLKRQRAAVLVFLLIVTINITSSISSWSQSRNTTTNTNASESSRETVTERRPERIVHAVDQKVSVVVMNHNRPRMIRESQLLKTFTSHPNIDEILLCHSNPETKFDFQHEKVTNIDAVEDNNKMGLSLRFHYCSTARNDWVIIVDDDMELSAAAVDMLLSEFAANTKRIVGHYGRNYNWYKAPYRNGYDTHTVAGPAEVMLTKIMVMESEMCAAFFRHEHLMHDLLPESSPLWNGEDIFMSLVANHEYGVSVNGPFRNYAISELDVWEASDKFTDDTSGAADVSGNMDRHSIRKDGLWNWWKAVRKSHKHAAYRGKLWYTAKQRLAALEVKTPL
jgi:hypothetical protein